MKTFFHTILDAARRNCTVVGCAVVALSFVALIAPPVSAQTNGGSIVGNVLDPQGSAIAGAKVRVTKEDTGETQATQSTSAGSYRFDNLNPGTYSVSVEAKNFRSSKVDNVLVTISTTTGQDLHLSLGSATESVTVTTASAQLETESSDIGTSVGPKLVEDLPIAVNNGEMRTVIDFMFLVPGVVGGENDNKIAGGQVTGSTIEVDGGSVDSITGQNFDVPGYTPSVDAVQEFTILEAGYPAQYGRTTGGITNFGTRSGTNQYHGKAYDYFTNAGLNANSWYNNLQAAANPENASLFRRPADTKNEFGLTFGGPVTIPHFYNGHNRTFFFFSWEQFRQTNGSVNVSTVPTVANRNGDFTATLTNTVVGTDPCTGNPIYQGEIFDPATTTQVGNTYCRTPFSYNGQLNMIDPARFSTVAQNVLSYMPAPQNSSLLNNYAFRNIVPYIITAETIRIDHTFGEKDKIFGSYNPHEEVVSNQGQVIPGPASPFLYLTQAVFTHDAHVGYDHSFTPTTLNHVVLSLFRFTNFPVSPASAAGIDYSQTLGLGNNLGGTLFPSFNWGENYIGEGSWLQYKDYHNRIQLTDNVVHIIGKHTLNIGADARYQQFNRNFQLYESGNYNFARAETAGTNNFTTQSGNGFASFLLGQVSSANADEEAVVPQFLQHYSFRSFCSTTMRCMYKMTTSRFQPSRSIWDFVTMSTCLSV